jgi:hypothetical protein
MFLVFVAGALVYGLIAMLLAAIVWMFTTFFGLVIVGLVALGTIINFIAPNQDDDNDYPEGGDPRD